MYSTYLMPPNFTKKHIMLQVVTVNDYLARRDSEWVGQVHRFLGLEVGLIQANMDPNSRYKAYHADVTYVTNSEIGFGELPCLKSVSQGRVCRSG